jgi:hypothetical protein
MSAYQELIDIDRNKLQNPYLLFERIHCQSSVIPYRMNFINDYGGDYFLKEIILRHVGLMNNPGNYGMSEIYVTVSKISSYFKIMERIPSLHLSSMAGANAVQSASPLPVDNNIFSVSFSGCNVKRQKAINWTIEHNGVIELMIEKDSKFFGEFNLLHPEYVDVLFLGYFVNNYVTMDYIND